MSLCLMQVVIKIKNNGLELLTITNVLHTKYVSIHTNVSKADKRAIT